MIPFPAAPQPPALAGGSALVSQQESSGAQNIWRCRGRFTTGRPGPAAALQSFWCNLRKPPLGHVYHPGGGRGARVGHRGWPGVSKVGQWPEPGMSPQAVSGQRRHRGARGTAGGAEGHRDRRWHHFGGSAGVLAWEPPSPVPKAQAQAGIHEPEQEQPRSCWEVPGVGSARGPAGTPRGWSCKTPSKCSFKGRRVAGVGRGSSSFVSPG